VIQYFTRFDHERQDIKLVSSEKWISTVHLRVQVVDVLSQPADKSRRYAICKKWITECQILLPA